MNPNMVFDIETTGASLTMDDEMRQAMKQVLAELAEVQPMPDVAWFDLPSSAIASLMGIDRSMLGAEVANDEKSSGPISEINIANIL